MALISSLIIPTIILIVTLCGLIEKKEVFNLFTEGAKDGIKIVLQIFPTLVGIFICVGMLRNSGLLNSLANILNNVTKFANIPSEILPLIFIKPISGSATIAMATDLMNKFSTDSRIGLLAATIMSSSETTFYVLAVYLNSVKIKNSRKIFIPALLADLASIIVAFFIIK